MSYVFGSIIGYIIGSIPFSFLVGKVFGRVDLRKKGPGNLGTTNVIRNLGLGAGILAYALDMLKGLIPVLIIRQLWGYEVAIISGMAAIIGHCYSVFTSFHGGKGVAVSSGVIFAIDPIIAIILTTGQLIVFFATRMMGLASIITAVVLPIVTYLMRGIGPLLYASFFMTPFVIWQHRDNLKRLLQGTENKL